ncbi:MAG: heavy-metal-associated domain-containing protein [Paludibacter sp.]|nr:heavy-metal-associated domain-containing protein [Paludibacter sp.]
MESTFLVSTSECSTCNNEVLKTLGGLQGIFGAEMNRIDGKIVVSHTDEVTREAISKTLVDLGFSQPEIIQETSHDDPSIWGCAL